MERERWRERKIERWRERWRERKIERWRERGAISTVLIKTK